MRVSTSEIEKKLDKKITSVIRSAQIDKKLLPQKTDFTLSQFFSNKLLLISLIREGVPYSLFHLIQLYTPFTEAEWSEYLGISVKSLQRYKKADKTFKPIQSEKIIELSEVTNSGLDVFGNMDKFKLWL